MKTLLFLGLLTAPILGSAQGGGGPDITSAVIAYGVAAPFAGLCWLQLRRAQDRERELERKLEQLQQERLARERDLAGQLAARLYDGALLYREGTDRLSQGLERTHKPDEVAELVERMQTLLQRLEER